MGIKFYLDYNSPPCRAVVLFCKMNKIPFEEEIVSFVTGQTKSEEYRKVTEIQRVPAMDEDGWILTESIAILKYLCTKPQTATFWYPTDPKARARVEEFISWHHLNIRKNGALVFIALVLDPQRTGKPLDKEVLQQRIAEREKSLDLIERYYLKSSPYLTGESITLADLFGICEIMQSISIGYGVGDRPRLRGWFERVKADLQPYFDETNAEVVKLGSKFKLS